MDRWVIYHQDHRSVWVGDIASHSGFKGYRGGNHKKAFVIVDGRLCDANLRPDTVSETGLCVENCKRADPTTPCHCICTGQNHGIKHGDQSVAVEEEGALA